MSWKRLLWLAALLWLPALAFGQAPNTTNIQDTLYTTAGLVNGNLTIVSNQTFTTPAGYVEAEGAALSYTITNGVINLSLPPNNGSTPAGTSYTAIYSLNGTQRVYREIWVVPNLSMTNLSGVRATIFPTPTPMIAASQLVPPSNCSAEVPYFSWTGTSWTCVASSGSGLTSLNSLTGAVNIVAGSGITVTPSGQDITIAATGEGNPGGSPGQLQYNDAGAFGGFTLAGDCTISVPTITCTKTNGTNFGTFATAAMPGSNGQLLFNNNGAVGAEDPIVSGATAIGSAPSTNPVFVSTWDGTDIRVPLTTNSTPGSSDYALEVRNIPSGTQTVTGSVSLTGSWPYSGALGTVSLTGTLPAFASTPTVNAAESGSWTVTATQATGSNLHMVCDSGCSSSSSPSFGAAFPSTGTPVGATNGTDLEPLQVNGSGYLETYLENSSIPVTGTFWQSTQPVSLASLPALASGSNTIGAVTQASGPWTVNLTQLDSTALGAPSNYGTSPGAVAVQGVNAYVTGGTLIATQSSGSNLHVDCDSGCSSSSGFTDNSSFTVGTTAINVIGGLYDTSDPTITGSGDAARARIDSHSYLFSDMTALAGTVLGAPSAYGTSPGAVEVIGVNAYVTNTPAVTQSGNWTARIVGNAGGILDAAQGGAAPANGLVVAGVYNSSLPSITSGDISQIQIDTKGQLLADLNYIGGASFGQGQRTSANSISIVPASDYTAPNVGPALPGTAATDSALVGAIYNSSAPSLSNGQQASLQIDSSGRLIVDCGTGCSGGGGTSSNFGSAFPTVGTAIGASNGTDMEPLEVNGSGYLETILENSSIAVTGTFWQTTQPVSCTAANCSVNLADLDGTALGGPSNYGTSPGAVEVQGVNAYVTNSVAVTGTFWQTTQPVSGSGVFEVGPTGSANTVTNPFFNEIGNGTNSAGLNGSSYSSTYGLNANILGLDGAVFSASNALFGEVTDGTNPMGAMANFNSSPGAVKALNVNAAVIDLPSVTIGTNSAQCVLTTCATQTAPLPESSSTYALSAPYWSAALTTAASVKASAGNVYGWAVYNPNASLCVLDFYNGSPTLGTTTPIFSLPLAAGATANFEGALPMANFSTSIYAAAETADKGSSTCSTGLDVSIFYN